MNYNFLPLGVILFTVIFLYAGYRYLPQRRIFYVFAAVTLLSAGTILWFGNGHLQKNDVTEAQKMQILSEQPFFVTWYESYKQYLDEIDRIWGRYNNVVDKFARDDIDAAAMEADLLKIQKDSDALKQEMEGALPPQELSDANYRLSYDILEKTRQYLSAQNETVRMTVQTAGAPGFKEMPHDIQYKKIDDIRILNAPVNLNIASDISSIRDNLSLPELSGS